MTIRPKIIALDSLVKLLLDVRPPPEVDHGVGVVHRRVLDLVLLREIIQRRHRRLQTRHGQEGGQVGRVGCNDDEAKQPPETNNIKLILP